MPDNILEKMKRGVYYPGHHLGTREELERLVAQGYLKRMDASSFAGRQRAGLLPIRKEADANPQSAHQ